MYRNIVQRARLSGFGSTVADGIEPRAFRPFETRIYADVTLRPLPWLGITADIELYWKRVYNQPEYVGQILDLLQSDYYSPRYIMVGSGYNTGANLTLRKEAGSLTASLSAGYGVARRKYPGFGSYTRGRPLPAMMGCVRADVPGVHMELPLLRPKNSLDTVPFIPQFTIGQRYDVTLCRVSPEVYEFWDGYNNLTIFGGSQFVSASSSLRGNIRGGFGVWSAQGASTRLLEVK